MNISNKKQLVQISSKSLVLNAILVLTSGLVSLIGCGDLSQNVTITRISPLALTLPVVDGGRASVYINVVLTRNLPTGTSEPANGAIAKLSFQNFDVNTMTLSVLNENGQRSLNTSNGTVQVSATADGIGVIRAVLYDIPVSAEKQFDFVVDTGSDSKKGQITVVGTVKGL